MTQSNYSLLSSDAEAFNKNNSTQIVQRNTQEMLKSIASVDQMIQTSSNAETRDLSRIFKLQHASLFYPPSTEFQSTYELLLGSVSIQRTSSGPEFNAASLIPVTVSRTLYNT